MSCNTTQTTTTQCIAIQTTTTQTTTTQTTATSVTAIQATVIHTTATQAGLGEWAPLTGLLSERDQDSAGTIHNHTLTTSDAPSMFDYKNTEQYKREIERAREGGREGGREREIGRASCRERV